MFTSPSGIGSMRVVLGLLSLVAVSGLELFTDVEELVTVVDKKSISPEVHDHRHVCVSCRSLTTATACGNRCSLPCSRCSSVPSRMTKTNVLAAYR